MQSCRCSSNDCDLRPNIRGWAWRHSIAVLNQCRMKWKQCIRHEHNLFQKKDAWAIPLPVNEQEKWFCAVTVLQSYREITWWRISTDHYLSQKKRTTTKKKTTATTNNKKWGLPALMGALIASHSNEGETLRALTTWTTLTIYTVMTAESLKTKQHFSETESTRKLSNFNFQWTKTLCQNNLKHIAFLFTFFFRGYRCN